MLGLCGAAEQGAHSLDLPGLDDWKGVAALAKVPGRLTLTAPTDRSGVHPRLAGVPHRRHRGRTGGPTAAGAGGRAVDRSVLCPAQDLTVPAARWRRPKLELGELPGWVIPCASSSFSPSRHQRRTAGRDFGVADPLQVRQGGQHRDGRVDRPDVLLAFGEVHLDQLGLAAFRESTPSPCLVGGGSENRR